MGVIKAEQAQQADQWVRQSAFSFEDMSERAEEFLADIRTQAENILSATRAQVEQIRQQAYQEGQQQSVREAEQLARQLLDQRLATLYPALESTLAEVRDLRDQWLNQWEADLLALACGIAERLIQRELTQRPEIRDTWIREALELASAPGPMRLHLNPNDLEGLAESAADFKQKFEQLAPTELVADEQVPAGECRVTTEDAEVDMRVKSQLERLQQELTWEFPQ